MVKNHNTNQDVCTPESLHVCPRYIIDINHSTTKGYNVEEPSFKNGYCLQDSMT